MRAVVTFRLLLPLLAAAAVVWPHFAQAQAFSADYGLPGRGALAGFGEVRIQPLLQVEGRYAGAGLSVEAGRNWFAQVGVGRSLQQQPVLSTGGPTEVVNLAGGYRWNDGQSLSLQLNRGRAGAGDRLGLAVSYDWPRYFVRLSYDSGLSSLPQDNIRFSAGMRF